MLAAKSNVQQDTPEVRVTEWRLAPGAATGHHTHGMDYVIVPITTSSVSSALWASSRANWVPSGPGKK